MKDNFEASLKAVLKHEGGFVNHPKDPGGMTNLGVTKKVWEEWVGLGRASKTIQKAVGATPDGAIGAKTMQAIRDADQTKLVENFSKEKENFYRSLATFGTFGKGWLRRVAETKTHAESMLA